MVYQWKTKLFNVNAQDAGEELERIQNEKGKLTPQNIVDESRSTKAVLHSCFEWNDSTAAEHYREQQARSLVCNIVTVEIKGEPQKQPVRAFVNIVKDETGSNSYQPIEAVLSRPDYTQQMLTNAKEELNCFRSKYSTLSELSEVFAAIDHLE